MSCVPRLHCHLSAPFVPLVPSIRRAVGITILSTPLQPFPHLGQGLGQVNNHEKEKGNPMKAERLPLMAEKAGSLTQLHVFKFMLSFLVVGMPVKHFRLASYSFGNFEHSHQGLVFSVIQAVALKCRFAVITS